MNYEVGDIVKIREWDDMEQEFGVVGTHINVPFSFTSTMRYLCGQTLKIKDIKIESAHDTIYNMVDPENPYGRRSLGYNFSRGMFTSSRKENGMKELKVIFQIKTDFREDLI